MRNSMFSAAYLALLLCSCSLANADMFGRVVAVTDGDNIKVIDETNMEHKVRLTGIDAPERGQPFGNASTKNLNRMVAGKQVRVEFSRSDQSLRLATLVSGCG